MTWVYRFVRWLIDTALGFYYSEVEIRGQDQVPRDKPLLLMANHQISMIDPLLLISGTDRQVRFIAKAPLFKTPVISFFMKKMKCIPAYRKQDPGYAKEKNDQLFEAVGAALREGGAIGIFPEGKSHDDPALAELRHGAAKMGLTAEAAADFKLGLHMQLVGIHFEQTRLFRGRILVTFGPPLTLEPYKEKYATDERAATDELTRELKERLSSLVLDATDEEDIRLAEVVDRLGLWEKPERGIQAKFDRKKFILEEYQRLRENHPREIIAIRARLKAYVQMAQIFGEKPGADARAYRWRKIASVLTNTLLLALGTPLLAFGIVVNCAPFWMVRVWAMIRTRVEGRGADVRAGLGMLGGLFFYPLWYGAMIVTGIFLVPWWVWVPIVILGPTCGVFALNWLERWRHVARITSALWLSFWTQGSRRRLARLKEDLRARIQTLRQ